MGMVRSTVSCLAVAAMLMTMAKATSYTVGDADGWSSGGDYTTWVSGKTFKVGDKIVFTYLPNHDVLEVLKVDYESCTGSSPISSDSSGSTTISLTAVGNRYFICGTIGHCDQGMKLQVDVLGSSSPSPPEIPPPSPPLGTPPPSPRPATPPPSPRAATPPPSPRVASPPPPVATPPPSSTPATPPPSPRPATPPPSPRAATPPPPVATPPPSSTPATPPPSSRPATPPVATPPPATPPTTTPASPPVSSPPPKTHTPKSAPTPAKSPTSTPKVGAPSPTVSKVTPTPQPSSAYKISYVASFAFAWMMLSAAI